MAVEDGVVTWIGEDRTGRALHPGAEVIDLSGAFVAPAFVDTHVHLSATGLRLTGPHLATPTRAAALAELRGHATAGVVLARGWDPDVWPDGPLTVTDLDAACGDRAVYAARVDEHSAQASTALRAAVPDLVALDGYHPELALTGPAHDAVRVAAQDALTDAQITAAHRAALDAAAATGIVAVHECSGPEIAGERDFALLRGLQHGVQVRRYWGEAARDAAHATELMTRTGAHGLAGDLFVDGSLGSHTALLSAPYADADTVGTAVLDQAAVTTHVLACTEARIQAGFHAIGDAAVGRVVTALAAAVDAFGGPRVAACGHRIEHAEMVTARQAERLGAWAVHASMQPAFDALWGGGSGMYARRLGPDRAAGLNDFALLARNAVPLAFSSDSPVTPLDPWATIRAATTHHTAGSAVSPRAAFTASTRGAWRAGGVRDGIAGTLVPGAPASYAVWDVDELVVKAPADAVARWSTDPRAGVAPLPDLSPGARLPRCLRTVSAGVTIFEAA
ncbi:amidohydrolase [Tsukamurella soli]|uniref:Amidohydrolase n=2 Tax=Tsukamurella soli TaxID=644556 RepID=A0ABP8J3J7_9ACTN